MKLKLRTPVAWLGTHAEWVIVGILAAVAITFRFWQLSTLPPGLTPSEAEIGLAAWNLVHHGGLPGLTVSTGLAPLWTTLQALPVALLGPTELALRLWPALIGTAAVLATWRWAHDWFGRRVGWVAAFVVAVTPWSVTISRNGLPEVLILLLTPLTLWAAGWTYHRRTAGWWLLTGTLLVIDLFAGPLGWLLALTTSLIALTTLWRRPDRRHLGHSSWWGLSLAGAGLVGFGYLIITSLANLKAGLELMNPVSSLGSLGHTLVRLLAMFNLRGDDNFSHNFASEPLLNAFIGLMFIAGLLASVTRIRQTRYRLILSLLVIFLLPVALTTTGAPNAVYAAAALPLVALLAGIGVSYMLELWYATFPINSAARSLGQAAIIVLLILSLFQGHAQYFRAWATSSETYAAYHEAVVGAAKSLRQLSRHDARYLVATTAERPVGAYLLAGQPYQFVEPTALATLPLGTGPQHFAITRAAREQAVQNLRTKYPGGTLKPHTSALSQNEIYYTYEVIK